MKETHDAALARDLRRILVDEHDAQYWVSVEAGLAAQSASASRRHRSRLKWGAAAMAAAASIAIVAGLVGMPGSRTLGPASATAYERCREAIIRARQVHSLVMTTVSHDGDGTKTSATTLWLAENGDSREETRNYRTSGGRLEPFRVETYDFASNTTRAWDWGTSAAGLAAWRRGGPPCRLEEWPGENAERALPSRITWYRLWALGALQDGNGTVEDGSFRGRPTLNVTIPCRVVMTGTDVVIARYDLAIDKESGLILDNVSYDPQGAIITRETVTDLEINPVFANGEPATGFPKNVSFQPIPVAVVGSPQWRPTPEHPVMLREDTVPESLARRVSLDELGQGTGVTPYVPGWRPEGFSLWQTTVGGEPDRRLVAAYRAGLEYFLVTVYRGGSRHEGGEWDEVELTGGAFAGRMASVTVDKLAGIQAEVNVGDTFIHVTGTLSRDEIVRIMNSFEVRGS